VPIRAGGGRSGGYTGDSSRRRCRPVETPFIVKLAIVLVLFAIIGSLALALVRLNKDRGRSNRTVTALTFRIVMSLALFFLIVLGFLTGVIVPHGVTP
jgi:hypothetical protein